MEYSRLKTWKLEQWNMLAWWIYRQIVLREKIKKDSMFRNYDIFVMNFDKSGKGQLSDLRGVAKDMVKKYEQTT